MICKNIIKKVKKVFLISAAVLTSALIISTVTHNVLKYVEQKKYGAPGILVDVSGEKIHVYSEGSRGRTIVLLSGYGTASPVLDFSPLIKELKNDYKVVAIENFGYGWSDITSNPRTVENIVEETRTALKEAGFEPPYILIPHSIWGIYSLYYTNKYPDEIEAVVGIDSSVPAQIDNMKNNAKMSNFTTLAGSTGLIRIVTKLVPSLTDPQAPEGTYSEQQLKLIRLMFCWHYNNKSLINEYNQIVSNIKAVSGMKYPKTLPVLFFLSEDTINFNRDWLEMHHELISASEKGECNILSGGHYLHRTCSVQMADEIRKFFAE